MITTDRILTVLFFTFPWFMTFDYWPISTGGPFTGRDLIIKLAACAFLPLISRIEKEDIPFVAFGLLYAIWIPLSPYPHYAVDQSSTIMAGIVVYLGTKSARSIKIPLIALVCGGTMGIVITSGFQLFELSPGWIDVYGNRNLYAQLMILQITALIYIWAEGETPTRTLLIFLPLLAGAIWSLISCGSRGAIAGVLVALAWVWVWTSKNRAIIPVVMWVLLAAFSCFNYDRFQGSDLNSFLGQRPAIWSVAIERIRKSPVLGSGPGSFRLVEENIPDLNDQKLKDAHNDYLNIMSETGVVGLVLFMWMIFNVYAKTDKNGGGFVMLAGFTAMLAGGMVTSLTIRTSTFILLMIPAGVLLRRKCPGV